jgi:integrase
MGENPGSGVFNIRLNEIEEVMRNIPTNLVDGSSALSPSEQLEAELARDRWDARTIPGLRYAPHDTKYYVDFRQVPEVFRSAVKDFLRLKLVGGRSATTLNSKARYLGHFLTFFLHRYPSACTLYTLSFHDIDAFILYLKTSADQRGVKNLSQNIYSHLVPLKGLLFYLERVGHPIQPNEPATRIVWRDHYPQVDRSGSGQVKYIPQTVLSQLDAHIQHLRPFYIPLVTLLRASGWRIADILFLKWDTCLEQDGEKMSLVGDIQKRRVLGHKIPITKEIGVIVLAQIEWVKQHYTPEENPKRWLFPASKRMRNSPRFQLGNPLASRGLYEIFDRLAEKYQIKDEAGNIFPFRLHAFRHAKAVELVNNGMSLLMVQQWMAHASPEMTVIYAKILDETLRRQWEKTVQQGIVQFNDGKPAFVPGKTLLPMAGENTFDPERVREHRQNVKMALGSCLKTAKIMCKFVELPCFHCPAYVLTPDDLPALEAYEQQILERIEIGKQAGNIHWIDVNQKNLDERVRPAMALLRGGHIVAKTDKQEREYTNEEWERRQHKQEEENHE